MSPHIRMAKDSDNTVIAALRGAGSTRSVNGDHADENEAVEEAGGGAFGFQGQDDT